MEKARKLVIQWSKSKYARERGMSQLEVNHWLKGEGIDIPWAAINALLERLVEEGILARTTSVGSKRVSYPAYIYWPKEESETISPFEAGG